MRYTIRAFLLTASALAALTLAYALIELARGHVPFAMLRWDLGGKFITLAFGAILAIGTAIGFASDRLQTRR